MAMWDNCAICGRAIPIGEPCYGVKNWRGDPIGGDTICRDCLVLENVPTLTPPNEWVSVEERLPEYNPGTGAKSYWVAKKDNAGNWQMKIAQYCDYGYAMTMDAETEVTWRDWDFTKIVNVTHWMPLPERPKEDE